MPQFKQVDVFTSEKFKGNPVAVFFGADHLSTEEMSKISAWTNLSEATFVVKPTKEDSSYHVRIFSLEEELPFAGHPTVGTCFALLEAGLIKPKNGKIIQECQAGQVELTVDEASGRILFLLPYARRSEVSAEAVAKVENALGVSSHGSAIYDVGPVWLTVKLDSAETVLALKPDWAKGAQVSRDLGIAGFQVIGQRSDRKYETRTFAPVEGINEDPVCGSGSGATGAYLRDSEGLTGSFQIRQGTILNRAGDVFVEIGEKIHVGGNAVTVINGEY